MTSSTESTISFSADRGQLIPALLDVRPCMLTTVNQIGVMLIYE